ncbi:YesL family protein [Fictibacillus phosphorivorans]|uniref:YesL family protein n=1 Tax=Fictibacillus phosphorivorans TaxID=1221500 RepID=UPI00204116B5|nr:DUF624 domain-containing protein [Fictibacillus phosphorivorans]MCM3718536.1 DUF624 domain-containing protein [Fictibacillus phosphorivorans]MCM3776108.1 DUF624 domain-containing protein [Fictibacillus phosphorivorans]
MNGVMGKINILCDWLIRLVLIQCYWVLFSLLGLVVFGLVPSTMAMFSVTRQLVIKHEDLPLFRTFKENFMSQFWKGNGVGAILFLVSAVLYVDYRFFIQTETMSAVVFLILMISFFAGMILCFLFPVFAHYDVKVWEGIKNSVFVCLSHLHYGLLAVVGVGLLIVLYVMFSGLLILIGGSTIAMFLTILAQKVFKNIEQKYLALRENELT